ncbi:MAG: enoyl-CoA hydratase [Hyphomicrobiaceae bacterium]|nr:enoyl-CoA hydratase [Hyphomicrobiaceae bacterium]
MSQPLSKAAADAAPDAPFVLEETDASGVRTLTLNRPRSRNALSLGMMDALADTLDRAGSDPAVRIVVVAAEGPAFCAGHDLKELTAARQEADRGRAFFERTMTTCAALMTKVVRLPKPVIARVHALATAAGCQLVASCDLAIAADHAGFCTPGVNIGLFCSTPMVALTRNVPRKQAMEMLLTGRVVHAEEALGLGLVNKVVAGEALVDETAALAHQIAAKSALTVKIGKEAFYRQAEMDLDGAYRYAAEVMVENMLARDAEEGIGAFIEKRSPTWEDR